MRANPARVMSRVLVCRPACEKKTKKPQDTCKHDRTRVHRLECAHRKQHGTASHRRVATSVVRGRLAASHGVGAGSGCAQPIGRPVPQPAELFAPSQAAVVGHTRGGTSAP
eukprot:5159903-Prymnesium_polylepis.1